MNDPWLAIVSGSLPTYATFMKQQWFLFLHYLEYVTTYVAPYLIGYNSWSKETTALYFCHP